LVAGECNTLRALFVVRGLPSAAIVHHD